LTACFLETKNFFIEKVLNKTIEKPTTRDTRFFLNFLQHIAFSLKLARGFFHVYRKLRSKLSAAKATKLTFLYRRLNAPAKSLTRTMTMSDASPVSLHGRLPVFPFREFFE